LYAIRPKQGCFFFESALRMTKPSRLQQNGLPAKCCVDHLTPPGLSLTGNFATPKFRDYDLSGYGRLN
jgi:hypothetical protein